MGHKKLLEAVLPMAHAAHLSAEVRLKLPAAPNPIRLDGRSTLHAVAEATISMIKTLLQPDTID